LTRTLRTASPSPLVVATVASLLTVVLVSVGLNRAGWDPTVFVGFGEDAVAITEYATERLGAIELRPVQGHDGKFFFVQANDPWVTQPTDNAAILDHPIYRSQRMLYPVLAGGFGLFGPTAVTWGLLVVNILAMGLGTFATARLSRRLGGSTWWGLAFVANFGLLYTLTNDDAGILAAALAMWAVAMVYEERLGMAIALLAGAALTREVMVVCAAGLAVWLWSQHRRKAALVALVVPGVAIAGWIVYLRYQLGPDQADPRAVGWPFVGLARAVPEWLADPVVALAGVAVLVILALFTVRWAQTRTALGWMFIGFVPLAALLTDKVWREIFDYTRAVAPLLTAAMLLIFVEARAKRERSAIAGRSDAKVSP